MFDPPNDLKDPCPNCGLAVGFSTLDYLCRDCFDVLIVKPALDEDYDASRQLSQVLDQRYALEAALGLRPLRPDPSAEGGRTALLADSGRKVRTARAPSRDDDEIV